MGSTNEMKAIEELAPPDMHAVAAPGARSPRLVTLAIGFRLETDRGLHLDGHTTGLNENGLAGRVNICRGPLPPDPAGLPVVVRLNLPGDRPLRAIHGEILHVSPSWVPGFRHFVAIRFLDATPAEIDYLRRFIAWRETDTFLTEKPIRTWYAFSHSDGRVFGPLTQAEMGRIIRLKSLAPNDLIWSPTFSQWLHFGARRQDPEIAALETAPGDWIHLENAPSPESAAAPAPSQAYPDAAPRTEPQGPPAWPEPRAPRRPDSRGAIVHSFPIPRPPLPERPYAPAHSSPTAAAPVLAATGTVPATAEPTVTSPRGARSSLSFRRLSALVGLLPLAAAFGYGFWTGWLDPTAAGTLYREGRLHLRANERYLALQSFDRLRREFPGHRLTTEAERRIAGLMESERVSRDVQMARAKLDLLLKIPAASRRLPAVLNSLGDCYFRIGDYENAAQYFQLALQHSPQNPVFRYNLGTTYLKTGQPRLAAEYFSGAPGSRPRQSAYYLNAGISLVGLNQSDRARGFFDEALRLAPDREAMARTIQSVLARTWNEYVAPTLSEPLGNLHLPDPEQALKILKFELPNPSVLSPQSIPPAPALPDLEAPPASAFLINDFDNDGLTDREVVTSVGSWSTDGVDPRRRATVRYDARNRWGPKGYCLALSYDLASPLPLHAGAWMRFKNAEREAFDGSGYRALSLRIRGDAPMARIELRTEKELASVLVNGVGAEWKEFKIPLSRFEGISDWRRLTEALVILDADALPHAKGVLYIDEVVFLR
jgi:tetratricopeptide (TPR) repeat protein